MKKIISLTSVLLLISSIQSCRQDDEEPLKDFKKYSAYEKQTVEKQSTSSKIDTVKILSPLNNEKDILSNPMESDPPPKNGQQWKN
nr:hypothetical protein [uncultured Chryseobacterium sp.]